MGWKICAVDGLAKAGKSTLANQLAGDLASVHVVSLDDFFLPNELRRPAVVAKNIDLDRLLGQVLDPALSGRPVRYQKFNWGLGRVSDRFVELPQGTKIIVDGTYSLHVGLRYAYDFSIFVQTPEAVRAKRLLPILGEQAGNVSPAWDPEELIYLTSMDPANHASTVISGNGKFPATQTLLTVLGQYPLV